MIDISVEEIQPFMSRLFGQAAFDDFLLIEADIVTDCSLHVTGRRNPEWYDTEQLEQAPELGRPWITWGEKKALLFAAIRGHKSPQRMTITLKACETWAAPRMEKMGAGVVYEQYHPDLFLHIRFGQGELHLVTGTAFASFTMDRSIEQGWDSYIRHVFGENT